MDNSILDGLTIISVGLNVFALIVLFLINKYSKDVTITHIKAGLKKVYTIAVMWTVDHKFKFLIPEKDPKDPNRFLLPFGKEKQPIEIKKGSVGLGPDMMDYVLMSENCTSSIGLASINFDDMTDNKVGSTPAYVKRCEDLAYAEGFNDGFQKSKPNNLLDSLNQNLGSIITLMFIIGIGLFVMYDKIITSPAAYGKVQGCEQEKGEILAKCAPYIQWTPKGLTTTTTTIPDLPSGVGLTNGP